MSPWWLQNEEWHRAIWQRLGCEPTPEQVMVLLDDHRIKEAAGGERGGKSYLGALALSSWLLAQTIARQEKGLFWIVGPSFKLARPEFEHFIPMARKLKLLVPGSLSLPKEGQWALRTRPYGTQIFTCSSTNPDTLAGDAPDAILMVEAAQQTFEAFLRCRGRVGEKRGPLLLSGTFEGSLGWYVEKWNAWQGDNVEGGRSFSIPTWSNYYLYPGGRQDPEILALEATYPHDVFMERFGAIPCPPSTLVLREFDPKVHVTFEAEYVPGVPVQLWVDPGYRTAYAVLAVQMRDGLVYNFDEVYVGQMTAQEVIGLAKRRDWWGDTQMVVMDVAGRTHPAAESQSEIWQRETGLPVLAQPVKVVDGILRHRTFLKDPATGDPLLFHHPQCVETIREYGLYKYPEGSERRPISEMPVDRDNHAMKALAYGLVHNFGHVAPRTERPQVSVHFRRC